MNQYPDIAVHEGDQIVTTSKEGVRCKRIFIATALDMSDPAKTLYSLLTQGSWTPGDADIDIPIRMTPHPSIVIPSHWGAYYEGLGDFDDNNCFCADVLTVKSLSSTQAVVEVEYAPMNAMTQEASEHGDEAPGLLHIGSSVHTLRVFTDLEGNALIIPYSGAYTITQQGNPIVSNNKISAEIQVPSKLFRFYRRETKPRVASNLEGWVNEVAWEIAGFTCDPQTLLCTRVENETRDEGLSYIVMYEFQWLDLLLGNSSNNYVSPAADPSGGSFAISPWQIYGIYTLPNGTVGSTGSPPNIGPNQSPSDATITIYQEYDYVNFNSVLNLTPP